MQAVLFGHHGGDGVAFAVGANVKDDSGGVPFHVADLLRPGRDTNGAC